MVGSASDSSSGRNSGHSLNNDVWVGVVLFLLGASAAWQANGFDAASRTYPLVLGSLMAIAGLVLTLRAFRLKEAGSDYSLAMKVVLPAAVLLVLWVLGIAAGLGFVLPTFVMEFGFMQLCGVSSLVKRMSYAALVTAVSYILFVFALGVRIPASLQPWLL